jgi:uncharacterized protein
MSREAGPHQTRPRRAGRKLVPAVVVLAFALGIAVACTPAASEVRVEAPLDRGPDALPDGITVSGEGEVEGAPDTLSVDLGVTVKRPTVGEAVAVAGERAEAVLAAVRAHGVAEGDVQTRDYRVNQEFRYEDNRPPIPDGFRVFNTVTVRIRDLPGAGTVIDAVTAAGGDDVVLNGVAFSLEEDGPALTAARENAFRDARAKAEQYAELAGRPIGAAQAVSDVVVVPFAQQFSGDAAMRMFSAEDASTPIRPGEVTTRVTVNARFTFA